MKSCSAVYVFGVYLTLSLCSTSALGQDREAISPWDTTLPSVQLTDVHVEGRSLLNAWKRITTDYMLRSVLYVSEGTDLYGPSFSFSAARCTASDLFDALIATYTDLTWTQDERTGVVWFHPRTVPYVKILSSEVSLASAQPGIPMLTGILEPLIEFKPLRLRQGPTRTAAYTITNNYAVNLPQGTYAVRDLLNICCVAHPSGTFFVRAQKDITYIKPVSLYPDGPEDQLKFPRPGALHWWTTVIAPLRTLTPQDDEIIAKLASTVPEIRSAARAYLLLAIRPYTEDLIKETVDPVRALWVCLAATDIHARTESATGGDTVDRMKKEATDGFLLDGPADLAVLTALELARVGKDTSALEVVARRRFSPGELSGIVSDAFRIARSSQTVRHALRKTGVEWLRAGEPKLSALGSPVLSHKLQFSVRQASIPSTAQPE